MNEELQNALTRIINETVAATGAATDFVLEQTPDVLIELLLWKAVQSILMCVLALVILWVTIYTPYKYVSFLEAKIKEDFHEELRVTYVAFLFLVLPVMLIFDFFNLDWLQIWLAPKVYLIEYAANLVN